MPRNSIFPKPEQKSSGFSLIPATSPPYFLTAHHRPAATHTSPPCTDAFSYSLRRLHSPPRLYLYMHRRSISSRPSQTQPLPSSPKNRAPPPYKNPSPPHKKHPAEFPPPGASTTKTTEFCRNYNADASTRTPTPIVELREIFFRYVPLSVCGFAFKIVSINILALS